MFRGGDYIDNPKFYNHEVQIKNSLDVSDIVGAKAKSNYPPRSSNVYDGMGKPPTYGGMPSMSPAMIGSVPNFAPPQRVNNVLPTMISEEDQRNQFARKDMYNPSSKQRNLDDSRVAGVKLRPKTGERSINDVFNSQSDLPNKNPEYPRQQQQQPYESINVPSKGYPDNTAAGVRNGSPRKKNESSVFSHLQTDGSERARRDPYEIQKPRVVQNNLSATAAYDMPPSNTYDDELSKQFNEYYKMQQQMNQISINAQTGGNRNSSHQVNTHIPAPSSGFTKNSTSGNIIAHDIVDVRISKGNGGSTLQNNGNEIFNSGGYGGSQKASRRSVKDERFEQNFQKPMAQPPSQQLSLSYRDRNRSIGSGEYLNNYQNMMAAGGKINLDPNSKKPSVTDGKSRLFGNADENSQPEGYVQGSKNTGKRILHQGSGVNSYQNVMGGNYEEQQYAKQSSSKYMTGGVNPISNHNVDMYYPGMEARGY